MPAFPIPEDQLLAKLVKVPTPFAESGDPS
jgi:hypothetical protein